ncbi:MAG: hypothetical protein LBC52_04630 [Treponema sp.]|jgi:hypothetical protein|nr:hypothetical protein [Treponema sp.]
MKRKRFLLLGIVCVPLVLGACVSQVIFDESLPLEESAHLFFYGELNITEYNGIPVPYKKIFDTTSSNWRDVYLPPGEMEFMLDVYQKIGNFIFTAKDVLFRYKFDAGKYYTLTFTRFGGPDEDQWGVRIYDAPPPKVGWPKSEDFLAFAAFYKP